MGVEGCFVSPRLPQLGGQFGSRDRDSTAGPCHFLPSQICSPIGKVRMKTEATPIASSLAETRIGHSGSVRGWEAPRVPSPLGRGGVCVCGGGGSPFFPRGLVQLDQPSWGGMTTPTVPASLIPHPVTIHSSDVPPALCFRP